MRKFFIGSLMLTGIYLLVGIFQPVNAASMRVGEDLLLEEVVPPGSLFAAGTTLVVRTLVAGDLYCAGQNVTIDAVVTGDVICIAQTLSIAGSVGGNVRVAAQTLMLSSGVERNITVAGQSVSLNSDDLGGEVYVAGQTVSAGGVVAQDLYASGDTVTLTGIVDGNVSVDAESLVIGKSASIGGSLSYASGKPATIDDGSSIGGSIVHSERPDRKGKETEDKVAGREKKSEPFVTRRTIVSIMIHMGLALLFVLVVPGYVTRSANVLLSRPFASAGFGLLFLTLTPVVLALLAITIIGLPFTLAGLVLYVLKLALARLIVALVVGQKVLESFIPTKKDNQPLAITIGVVLLWLTFRLPVIGGALSFVSLILGVGAMFLALHASYREKKKK